MVEWADLIQAQGAQGSLARLVYERYLRSLRNHSDFLKAEIPYADLPAAGNLMVGGQPLMEGFQELLFCRVAVAY
jgi:hypothetical protein